MPTDRQRVVARAVESSPPGSELLVLDGRTGRACARRPGSGPEPEAALLVVGPLNLAALGVERPAIRPSRRGDGASGEPDESSWLSPADRRRFRRERNRFAHAARAQAAPGATSAPHGGPDGHERPGARPGRDEAPTRPEVRVI
ncbi:MAG TPA: hypothetical protein VFW96_16910 [Thermomicrobiales bacterium]|nr:hypothetical protein [Thermomicrobiales bacterium]